MLMIDAAADDDDDDGDDGDGDGDGDAAVGRDCRVVLSDANCAVLSDPNRVVPSDPATPWMGVSHGQTACEPASRWGGGG